MGPLLAAIRVTPKPWTRPTEASAPRTGLNYIDVCGHLVSQSAASHHRRRCCLVAW